jgi:hypothetical protein
MLDLVYIVEDKIAPTPAQNDDSHYSPNFIMGSTNGAVGVKPGFGGAAAAGVAAAAGAALVFNPLTLLPTALMSSAMLGVPGLLYQMSKDRSVKSEEADAAKLEEARLLAAYVQQHSLSRSQAKAAGYRFQPGHPVVGKTYRKHPLTDFSNPDSGNLYIPSDSYDAILLEERESELIKLLVHLGATKVTITKKTTDSAHDSVSAGAAVQAGPLGGGNASYKASSQRDAESLDTREFTLTGRAWNADSKVDREDFYWLSYEPSWKAVVFAREYGGCLTASLEIRENTSFSTDKNFELSVKAKLTEVGVQAGITNADSEEKIYLVRAEFAPVQTSV